MRRKGVIMQALQSWRGWCALGASVVLASSVRADCPAIDFEGFAAGTAITSQYPGVTFSGRTTSGDPAGNPVIVRPAAFSSSGFTSSPTRCLSTFGDGINEFSCDYLRMDFALGQREVTFMTGVRTGCTAGSDTVQVRWYNASSTLLGSMHVPIVGPVQYACNTFVRVTAASPVIRRIEVQYGVSPSCACAYELIDDLTFNIDTTPPVADIVAPGLEECICDSVTFYGTAHDPDGVYVRDWLEYSTDPGGPWTLIGTAAVPAPGPSDALYVWSPPAGTALYLVRLNVENACGLVSQAVTVVWRDDTPPSVVVRSPGAGAIVGGTVCFDGTVADNNSCSLSNYRVDYRPAAGGTYLPVDPANATYTGQVVNDPFASWNTRSGAAAVADGDYTVRVRATDGCGQITTVTRNVTVDNTAPIAEISSPMSCTSVSGLVSITGTAFDAHMAGWSVQYTGGDAHGWVTIASGNASIVNGVLASWDTRQLRPCCYAIRLVVTDEASVDCGGNRNRTEYLVVVDVGGGCRADFNGDNVVNSQDYFDFLTAFFSGC
jgi:hypothetical protein